MHCTFLMTSFPGCSQFSIVSASISDTSLAFPDIKISIEGNGLCTSVYYKPTDSHSYLLYSSSHPSHVKNSIPFSQFLRLRRLCSEDSDFSEKSETMCQFFDKRGYPFSVVQAGHRQRLALSFRNPHLFHSNMTKT